MIGVDTAIAIIVALTAVGGLMISHRTLKEQIKEQNNTKYLEKLQEYSDKMVCFLEEAEKLETVEGCLNWIYKYLERCEVMVYAEENGQFPPVIEYFHEGWFSLGHTLMIWYDMLRVTSKEPDIKELRSAIKTWEGFAIYCRNNDIKVEPDELPERLIQIVPGIEEKITPESRLDYS